MLRTVRDLALRTPITALPETPVSEAEQILIAHNTGEIYVVDPADILLGVVTDYAILQYRLLGGDGQARIAALMSPIHVSIEPTDSIELSAKLMREQIHASLPVVQQGRLIGQLCRRNLLRVFSDAATGLDGKITTSVPEDALTATLSKPSRVSWGMPGFLRGAG